MPTREVECPICWDAADPVAFALPCRHGYCARCILKSSETSVRCPLCRQVMVGLESAAPPRPPHGCVVVDVRMGRGAHAGVTLADAPPRGVVVKRLQRRDALGLAGIRRGDVVLSINHVPTNSHAQAIALIEAASASGHCLSVVRAPRARAPFAPFAPFARRLATFFGAVRQVSIV